MAISEVVLQNFLNPKGVAYYDNEYEKARTNELANDKLRFERQQANALRSAVQGFGNDQQANRQAVIGTGSHEALNTFDTQQNAQAKALLEAQKGQREAQEATDKRLNAQQAAYFNKTALIDGPEKLSAWVQGSKGLDLFDDDEIVAYTNMLQQQPERWQEILAAVRKFGSPLEKQFNEALKRDELKGEQDWRATQTDTTRRGQDMTYGASTNNNTNTNLTSRQNNAANILSAQTIAAMPARPTAADNKPAKGFRLGPPDPDTGEPTWVAIKGGPEDQKRLNKVAGTDAVDSMIAGLRDIYTQLDTANAITNPTKGVLANVSAGVRSSDIGQATGKLFGTSSQSLRNTVAQQRPLLLQAIRSATGMSARQMDSNVELKLYLTAATDTSLDVETNKRALDMLEKLFGRLSLDRAGGDDADTAHSDRKRGGAVTTTLPHGGKFIGFEN